MNPNFPDGLSAFRLRPLADADLDRSIDDEKCGVALLRALSEDRVSGLEFDGSHCRPPLVEYFQD